MPEREIRRRLEKVRRQIYPHTNRSILDFAQGAMLRLVSGVNHYPETAFRIYSTNPHPLAIEAIIKFLPYNKNNIGTHTHFDNPHGLAKLEKEVVLMLGNLMGLDSVDGYITQGGTEGNIMGLWIGRNMLRDNAGPNKICLLKTSLTHYSIDKAADILAIEKVVNIPLNDEYGMNSAGLEKNIKSLSQEGYNKFLIALTLGYNTTGTLDPVDEIDVVILRLEKELGIKTYVHLDAAIGGLIYPFVAERPFDFHYASVQSISLDMHKTGFVPHTAGVFLCRKNLQQYVERAVPYFRQMKDDSLSSSRPAAAAAGCWSVINALGKEGFRKVVKEELELKNYFLSLLKKNNIEAVTISDRFIPIVAFYLKAKTLPIALEKKYMLSPAPLALDGREKKQFYTIIFMPHITKSVLEKLVLDLKSSIC